MIDGSRLVEEVVAESGLDDFGPTSWREGFDVLVAACNAEARLSELGEAAITQQLAGNLRSRLRLHDWARRNPAVRQQDVRRPLVVLGLPRTGTTLLSELLHRDPANRSLLRWEAADPVPPRGLDPDADEARLDAAVAGQAMLRELNPGFDAIHYEAPDGPTECVTLLAQDFKSLLWETLVNVATYGEWLLATDHTSAYDHHRLALAVLQSHTGGRWVLKTPHHCLAVPTLLAHYPDARLVMTHRDPATVAGSLISLVRSLSGTFSDADHREHITRRWLAVMDAATSRVMAFRDEHGGGAFCDVSYERLVADPVGTVRAIYAHFGEVLAPEAEQPMHEYVAANPQGRHGTHRYDLADFGLRADEIRERFARYCDRYDC